MLDALSTLTADLTSEAGGYVFGRFVLRRRERLLLAAGEPVALGSRAADVLLALVEANGALLTKSALLDRVWPGVVVEENNLQVQISALRRVLGADRDWIATVPGRGYRFVGPAAALPPDQPMNALRHAGAPPLSVAVLPFVARGGKPSCAWFADALTDGVAADLARALPPGSAVVAHPADDETHAGSPDARGIGRANGVRYVLEGSVIPAGERVRVSVGLVAAATGAYLWADRFDARNDGDPLDLQDSIVGRLADSVARRMVEAEQAVADGAVDPDARTPDLPAHPWGNRAITAEPDASKGRASMLRARGAFLDAIAAAEDALGQDPDDLTAHEEIGLCLLYLGYAGDAVAQLRRADALASGDEPSRWTWLEPLGRALLHLGRDAEAVEVLRLAVARDPRRAAARALLAAALALAGERVAARAAMAALRRAAPDMLPEALARPAAVPYEATGALFRAGDARVLEGLRRAEEPAAR